MSHLTRVAATKSPKFARMFGVFYHAIFLAMRLVGALAYTCPLPECGYCLEPQIRTAPGIGFELTASYGVSAVRYIDGSVRDVAMLHAQPNYIDLLTRLAQLASPPQSSPWSRYLRRLNRILGRPATKDVGILSTLIGSLATTTAHELNRTLNRVVVATPDFPALTSEDLNDAIEYVGLESWLVYPIPYPKMLYTANAAFAGSGRGLCTEWRNIYACGDEVMDGDIPMERVFAVSFTNTTLITSVSHIDYAFDPLDHDTHLVAPNLGLASLASYPSPTEYWVAVTQHLQLLPGRFAEKGQQISSLVLSGESATLPEFSKALKDALGGVWTAALEKGGEEMGDPRWVTARGAARYASIRQQVPWNCGEREECYSSEGDKNVSQTIKNELK
ncbi:hypothetical protein N7G274_008619 [Stereocaulon virgatum]|uniref:Uncharacterized protein n=1 Tax=Stereocaulon virgatum TaxID=373712 RepID=A0ABR4A0U3_9LECA